MGHWLCVPDFRRVCHFVEQPNLRPRCVLDTACPETGGVKRRIGRPEVNLSSVPRRRWSRVVLLQEAQDETVEARGQLGGHEMRAARHLHEAR